MTIGQRLSQLRRDAHLSQEELGEQLGVSRQSIYKWENDLSVPEIEKLITLSKLFKVSVGWLLGVEEESREAEEDAAAENGELTEQQLRMVEEITKRYIEAQPRQADPRWRHAANVVLVLLIAAGILTSHHLIGQMQSLQEQNQSLQNYISNVERNVGASVGGISERVEQILKEQNSLTAHYSTEYLSTDVKGNTITIYANAMPKVFDPDMRAVFCATQGETKEVTEVEGVLSENMEFSAEITCPLSDEIAVSVTFIRGDQKENQFLADYTYRYSETLPTVDLSEIDLLFTEVKKGVLNLSGKYVAQHEDHTTPAVNEDVVQEITSLRIGLFQDRKLIAWAEPCDSPSVQYSEDSEEAFCSEFFRLPMDLKIPAKEGDKFTLAAVIIDEANREFIHPSDYFEVIDGQLLWSNDSGGEYGYGSRSPEGWTY